MGHEWRISPIFTGLNSAIANKMQVCSRMLAFEILLGMNLR